MADIAATGFVDYDDRRVVYFPPANLQSALTTTRDLFRPDPPFTDYVPQTVDSIARFVLPKQTIKHKRCLVSVSLPPTIFFLNPVNGVAVNMKCSHLFFAADLKFDGKSVFTSFLNEQEDFYVDSELKQILLRTSQGRVKIDPINALPENGVNNTQLTFPLNAATSRVQIFFRPTVTFLK